jgi:diguanylate cyclase (GGDEF)-like protein
VLWWAYDITEQKRVREQLAQLANYDMLTGLANRRLFQDHLRRALARTRRRGGTGALLYIDLDGFKEVNDTLGHGFGDNLLAEAGKRIQACVRESDLVSRMGGDEFTLILEELPDDSSAETVAEKVLLALSLPFFRDGKEATISASIGIAYFDDKRQDGDDLLRKADRAMYQAKSEGRRTYRVFDPRADASDTERLV